MPKYLSDLDMKKKEISVGDRVRINNRGHALFIESHGGFQILPTGYIVECVVLATRCVLPACHLGLDENYKDYVQFTTNDTIVRPVSNRHRIIFCQARFLARI